MKSTNLKHNISNLKNIFKKFAQLKNKYKLIKLYFYI